jgi:hypothetical protein
VLKADADEIGKDDWMARKQRHEDSWRTHDTGPDRFVTISFANRRFFDKADFSGRTFEQAADFTQARFYYPPEFDPTIKDARIDFTGTHIGFVPPRKLHCTYETKVPVQLRRLRKIAEETKNHDLERDLYIEERKAERGVYWHQLVEELKKAPEELKKKLKDIEEQRGRFGRIRDTGPGRAAPTCSGSPSKLRGFSPTSSGSLSWASIGRLQIMAAASYAPPSRSV